MKKLIPKRKYSFITYSDFKMHEVQFWEFSSAYIFANIYNFGHAISTSYPLRLRLVFSIGGKKLRTDICRHFLCFRHNLEIWTHCDLKQNITHIISIPVIQILQFSLNSPLFLTEVAI